MVGLDTTASTAPCVQAWSPPSAFDEYKIVHPLGRGAMGQVYLARDTFLERLVAVKFIAARVLNRDERRERFHIEARAIARLHHPNVVMVYRVGEVDHQPYLVSEYVRGQRLDELPKPVVGPRLLTIAIDLARGLAAVHRHGVLHRDIKPANVMVTDEGVTKLLDFGLAKLLEVSSVETTATWSADPAELAPRDHGATADSPLQVSRTPIIGRLVGTPLYMAPEIWGNEPATRFSDVYSLGIVLYELCVGRAPHAGLSFEDLRSAATTTAVPPVRDVAVNVDAAFAEVVDRCVAVDPEQRFESGEALREALEAIAAPARVRRTSVATPYRGLRSFHADDRTVFFGRDAEVRAVLERLRTDGFVLVSGDSGVGKSSLVAAGVLPVLAEGSAAMGARFTVVRLVPGRRPVTALAAALAPVCKLDEVELKRQLVASPSDIPRLVRRHGGRVVVFVDQLEELITLADAADATTMADVLCELAGCGAQDVRLIATVRADFLARVAALSRLRAELPHALYLLTPLSSSALREVIIGPARALEWSFESEATIDALTEAATGPGALPLLAFALAELWEARDPQRQVIPAAALDTIGGVAGALVRHADAVLASLVPSDQVLARHVLSLLVTAEGTRARRGAAELTGVRQGAAPDRARAVVEALVRGRVLVERPTEHDEDTTYELAHEVLVSVWGTLRSWLNHDAEALAARARVERATSEWLRLGRARDALWQKRQLAEASAVHPVDLAPLEQEFLQRSRAVVRTRRAAAITAIAALPLMAGAAYGGNQWLTHRARDQEIDQRASEAAAAQDRARTRDASLEELRRRAFGEFDSAHTSDAERDWKLALTMSDQLDADYEHALQSLERALLLDNTRIDVRRQFAQVLYDTALAAERNHQLTRRDEILRRLRVHDTDGVFQARWNLPARLDVTATPRDSRVSVQRYEDTTGRFRLSPDIASAQGVLHEASIAAGSYLVTLSSPTHGVVRFPIFLERGQHRDVSVALPAAVPVGFVYVPPGPFLSGTADPENFRLDFWYGVPPLHEVETGPFFIQRTEVTMRQWLEFLRALPPEEQARRRPHAENSAGVLDVTNVDGRWELLLRPARTSLQDAYRAAEGELFHYRQRTHHIDQDWRDFPASGISWTDAVAYVAWLADTGRVPGARLCSDREWERAARGADGRLYPHGNRLEPNDADIDVTYGQETLAFGPDAVGTHPESDSPFGVADLAGNVSEYMRVTTDPAGRWYGGGSFYQDRISARSGNRIRTNAETRSIQTGLRVCADASAK